MIKKIQKQFSEEEWSYLKKYHKRSRTNSKKSSTLSHMSVEEEKRSVHSETSSVRSGPKSGVSSKRNSFGKKLTKAEKLSQRFAEKYELEEGQVLKEDRASLKKVVHFEEAEGHIELKDLTEKDFEDLLAAKNQDKRFYGWLHFGPIDDHKEKGSHPVEDIEYFRWLYDNNLFSSNDVTMEEEHP